MENKGTIWDRAIVWAGGALIAAGATFQVINLADVLFVAYLLTIRSIGPFIGIRFAFGDDPEAEAFAQSYSPVTGESDLWSDLLCPFLDTDMPDVRGRALAHLRGRGLPDWKIRLIRGVVGLGFTMTIADEWLKYDFSDLKARWICTIALDALVTGFIFYFSEFLGTFLSFVLAIEIVLFLGILAIDKRIDPMSTSGR